MTPAADRAVRAGSFGAVADDYDRFRPAPPDAAVAWLVPAGARTGLDLGAGTGALSELLARHVLDVVAVEPDRRMLAVLGRRVQSAKRVVARAETIPLRSLAADFVGVSSARHWMDSTQTLSEAARVLRPGGVLGVLWSGPDRTVPWIADVLGPVRPPVRPPDASSPARHRSLEVPAQGPFEEPLSRTFRASVPYRVDDLPALASSYSLVITLTDSERSTLLHQVREHAENHPALRGRKWVTMPLGCACFKAVRRATV
jgi:SAM-dependent methyltransferase